MEKIPLTKQVGVNSKTENGGMRRSAQLAGWLVDSQDFSQVVRSSWDLLRVTVPVQTTLTAAAYLNGKP